MRMSGCRGGGGLDGGWGGLYDGMEGKREVAMGLRLPLPVVEFWARFQVGKYVGWGFG